MLKYAEEKYGCVLVGILQNEFNTSQIWSIFVHKKYISTIKSQSSNRATIVEISKQTKTTVDVLFVTDVWYSVYRNIYFIDSKSILTISKRIDRLHNKNNDEFLTTSRNLNFFLFLQLLICHQWHTRKIRNKIYIYIYDTILLHTRKIRI